MTPHAISPARTQRQWIEREERHARKIEKAIEAEMQRIAAEKLRERAAVTQLQRRGAQTSA